MRARLRLRRRPLPRIALRVRPRPRLLRGRSNARLPRRPLRSSTRGQAIVVVGLMGLVLIAMAGLALDGGFEAGNFRRAQNAADSAALAAARYIYVEETKTPAHIPTTSEVQSVVDDVINKNGAKPGAVSLGYYGDGAQAHQRQLSAHLDGTVPPMRLVAASGPGAGWSVTSSTADATLATLTVPPSNYYVESSGSHASTSMSGSPATASAHGYVQVGDVNLPPLPDVPAFCVKSDATFTTATTHTTCPGSNNSFPPTLVTQSTDATVSPTDVPAVSSLQSSANLDTTPLCLGLLGCMEVRSSTAQQLTNIVPGLAPAITVDTYATGLNATVITGVTLTATSLHFRVVITASDTSWPVASYSCDPTTLTLTTATGSVPIPVASNCAAGPINLPGVVIKIGDITTSGCNGTSPSCSISGAFISVTIGPSGSPTGTMRIGTASAAMTAAAGPAPPTPTPTPTPGGTLTSLLSSTPNSVTVQAYVHTQTFFMGVLGWFGTNPAATATATINNVTDVSDDQFAASPYAIPDIGDEQDAPFARTSLLFSSAIGHRFYIYGPSMTTKYVTVIGMPGSWQGQVSSSGGHAVGSMLTGVTGVASGPSYFTANSQYYVLPIINPGSRMVEAYAVFKPYAGDVHQATLVDSVQAAGGVLPQANVASQATTVPWLPGQPGGALVIKLSQ